jgi:general secretion pathway protein J
VSCRSGRPEAGFTLLELLVSIALLGLLTMVLLAGLSLVMREVDRQTPRLDETAKLAVVYGFLHSHLADARPTIPVNLLGGAVAFDGGGTRVDFVAPAPDGATRAGLYLYSIEAAGSQLKARWRLFAGLLPAATEEAGETVLLDGLRQVDITYYGSPLGEAEIAWQHEWRNAPYLPLLVRFAFSLRDGGLAPALVVAPRPQPLRAVPVATAPLVAVPR